VSAAASQISSLTSKGRSGANAPDDRAWFLDSRWQESVWVFKPTNALEEGKPVRVDWRFKLPSGHVFVESQYARLLHSSKQLIALIRSRSLSTGLAQRASTAVGYFMYLRELLRWMDQAGFTRFADLDATALLQFQRFLAQRPGMGRDSLAPTTVQKYLYLLTYLYRFRDELDDGLRIDPFPGRSLGEVAGVRDADARRWPYTPQTVAAALIQGAIDLVNHGAAPILQGRAVYAQAMSLARQRGYLIDACTNAATRALRHARIEVPGQPQPILTVHDLAVSIDMLYAACFVVISYLVGLRSSEILHLEAGCLQRRSGAVDDEITVIVGAIFKRQPEYTGRPHEWVAPPPAVAAIAVLEALSADHRAQSGRPQLWLRRRQTPRATEWQRPCPGALGIPSAMRMRSLLQRFASWLGLPQHQGKSWRLSTHQGRKTFARFVALRDRSALFALAQHLGHRERAVTDYGYAGSDYRLNQEIEAEILEQSAAAWEHMLATPGLGGRAGAEIMARRPRFRGARLKQDIASYARMLVDAGLVLGVCDWGFCVYREESSACLGNARGPNPARREPSTCQNCRNFAVSEQHRSYWVEQIRRHEALLDEPSLPLQTLRIARERLTEARSLLRAIDANTIEADTKEAKHGTRIKR
jgi:integrase